MHQYKLKFLISFALMLLSACLYCQSRIDSLIEEQGRFDKWKVEEIKESAIIGGATKILYKPDLSNPLLSPTNVHANIIGIIKASNSVFPEKRGEGYCARLEVVLENVRAVGIINMVVVAQGTIVTGLFNEPIRDTKAPNTKLDYGIPYNSRPTALQLDYKAKIGNPQIRATGLSPRKDIGTPDNADIIVLLQKRWEDESGNIYAKRVGTAFLKITEDVPEWINEARVEIKYGDITHHQEYKEYMDLRGKDSPMKTCAINSKGKAVPIDEVAWAYKDETPTHIIIWASSSDGAAFYGGVGNTLWLDNLKLVYD